MPNMMVGGDLGGAKIVNESDVRIYFQAGFVNEKSVQVARGEEDFEASENFPEVPVGAKGGIAGVDQGIGEVPENMERALKIIIPDEVIIVIKRGRTNVPRHVFLVTGNKGNYKIKQSVITSKDELGPSATKDQILKASGQPNIIYATPAAGATESPEPVATGTPTGSPEAAVTPTGSPEPVESPAAAESLEPAPAVTPAPVAAESPVAAPAPAGSPVAAGTPVAADE